MRTAPQHGHRPPRARRCAARGGARALEGGLILAASGGADVVYDLLLNAPAHARLECVSAVTDALGETLGSRSQLVYVLTNR